MSLGRDGLPVDDLDDGRPSPPRSTRSVGTSGSTCSRRMCGSPAGRRVPAVPAGPSRVVAGSRPRSPRAVRHRGELPGRRRPGVHRRRRGDGPRCRAARPPAESSTAPERLAGTWSGGTRRCRASARGGLALADWRDATLGPRLERRPRRLRRATTPIRRRRRRPGAAGDRRRRPRPRTDADDDHDDHARAPADHDVGRRTTATARAARRCRSTAAPARTARRSPSVVLGTIEIPASGSTARCTRASAEHPRPGARPLARHGDARPARQRRDRRSPHQQEPGLPPHRRARRPATRSSSPPTTGRYVYRVVRTEIVARTRCGSSTRRRPRPRRCSPATHRVGHANGSSSSSTSATDRVPRRGRRRRRLGGFLVALSLPPWGWWPLALRRRRAVRGRRRRRPPSRRPARLRAGCFGARLAGDRHGAGCGSSPRPATSRRSLVFACFHGVAALAAPPGRWRVIGRPAAHTLVEALRFSFPFGGVPLASLGIAQAAGPLAGIARVGGVILHHVGRVPGRLRARRADRRGGARGDAGPSRWPSAPCSPRSSCWRCRSSPRGATAPGEFLDVAAVQGGGEQGTRAIDVPTPRSSPSATSRRPARSSPTTSLDLVLWPENVVDIVDFATSEELAAVAAEAGPARRAVRRRHHRGRARRARSVHQRPGHRHARRRGHEPLRQGAPGAVRRVRAAPRPARGARRAGRPGADDADRRHRAGGARPARRHAPRRRDLVGGVLRRPGPRGRARTAARLILNPTNGASYTGTIVQTQQVASSRLRAIETGRWVVQASPTGFSRVRHARRRRDRPHGGQRAGRDPPRVELRTGRHLVRQPRRPRRSSPPSSSCSPVVGRLAPRVGPAPPPVRRAGGDRRDGIDVPADRQRSRSTVTGPSLTSATCISVRKRPVATVAPSRAQLGDDARRRAARRAPAGRRRSSSGGGRRTCRRRA